VSDGTIHAYAVVPTPGGDQHDTIRLTVTSGFPGEPALIWADPVRSGRCSDGLRLTTGQAIELAHGLLTGVLAVGTA
jgi:hypothetical protein